MGARRTTDVVGRGRVAADGCGLRDGREDLGDCQQEAGHSARLGAPRGRTNVEARRKTVDDKSVTDIVESRSGTWEKKHSTPGGMIA